MRTGKVIVSLLTLLALAVSIDASADGDTENGKRIFNKCKACHFLNDQRHKVGPTLAGVIGRRAGTAVDSKSKLYRYSKAMREAGEKGIVWTQDNLEGYLTNPKAFVPKNKMPFPGLKRASDRADVIAYIRSRMK